MKMMEYNINPLEAEYWTLPTEMSGTTHFVTDIIKPECVNFTQENNGRVNVSLKVNSFPFQTNHRFLLKVPIIS